MGRHPGLSGRAGVLSAKKIGRISMEKDYLTLKGASASRPSGDWSDDDFDVLANGEIVGRIFKADVSMQGRGCGHWTSANTNTAAQHRATLRPARLP